uniref:Uncharacterized protein n=1 Tax=Steinernema glaseri TaxID=37863 RepID=A0A1I7YT48_9BILA
MTSAHFSEVLARLHTVKQCSLYGDNGVRAHRLRGRSVRDAEEGGPENSPGDMKAVVSDDRESQIAMRQK